MRVIEPPLFIRVDRERLDRQTDLAVIEQNREAMMQLAKNRRDLQITRELMAEYKEVWQC